MNEREPSSTEPSETPDRIRPNGRFNFSLPRLNRGRRRGGSSNWRSTLYGVWIAQLLVISGFSMRAPILPGFFDELGVHDPEGQAFWTGIMLSIGAGMMAITSPIWGTVADRFGRKPMLVRAQFAAFVTISLSAAATEPWQLVGLRVIEGAMTGTVAAATALIAVSMPKDKLGYGLGMVQTAVFSGSALGPLFGGVLADFVGYRPTFVSSGLMAFSAGVITLLFVHEEFERPTKESRQEAKSGSTWKVLMAPTVFALMMTMLLVRFASSAVQPITPIFVGIIADVGANVNTLAGVTLGILGVTSAISSIYLGRIGDKRGHYKVLLFSAIGAGLIYFPMAQAQAPWHLIVLQAIFGLFAGGMIPAANALIANATDASQRGMIFGWMNTAGSVGGFAGPLLGAGLANIVGIRWTFVLTGFVLLILAINLWWANRKQPMEPSRGASEQSA